MENRIIKFLSDHSIGILSFRAAGSNSDWTDFAEAVGNVVVPADKEARLNISPTVEFDPVILSTIEPDVLSVFGWVSTSKVTDDAIAHIQYLTGLQGLALWETNIGDEALWHLRHLSNLQWLDIGDTRITDEGLRHLQELALLRSLSLLNTQISDKGLHYLEGLIKLERLDLMNTLVTDAGVEKLENLTGLKSLRIYQTRITEAGYDKLQRGLPRCRIRFHDPHYV